jgi:hypothetical protein
MVRNMRSVRRSWGWALGGLAIGALGLLGCTGALDDGMGGPHGPGGGGSGAGPWGSGGSGGPGGQSPTGGSRSPDDAGYDPGQTDGLADRPAPAPRLVRLTHTRWVHTVQDLLHLDDAAEFAAQLRPDPSQGGFIFDNNGATLEVDEVLWHGYQRAALDVARYVTEDPARLAAILPAQGGSDAERARALVRELGMRAHRRPLTDAQVERYLALHAAGARLYPAMNAFDAGTRLLLEALLQSPYFLYHVESSHEPAGDVIPLDGYEVASRLSYMLWNTMPDDALFQAAESGELTRAADVAAQAARMLDDPRAEQVVASFHHQWLEVDRYMGVSPSRMSFPDAPAQLGAYAAEENARFVQDIYRSDGSYTDLLTSRRTFVNAGLAGVYGLQGNFGDAFQPVMLPANERSGLFTHIGFLAANATSTQPDPIHRGAFLGKRIACLTIAAPPDDIPPLPPAGGRTNRETIEDHTEQPNTACIACHGSLINPFGFPFEHYDAIGRYRTEDNGWPVDGRATPLIGDEQVPVADAVELAQVMAASPAIHECYAKYWVEFAYGRPRAREDDSLVQRLGRLSAEGGLTLKQLIVSLVRTEAFLTRSREELP